MGNENVQSDSTVQPGTEVSESLWRRFREDVKERRGRINGVLGNELERAIEEYLKASKGYNTEYQLEEIGDRLERIEESLEGEGPGPSRAESKNKKSAGKDSRENFSSPDEADDGPAREVPAADGGVPVDDRHVGAGDVVDEAIAEADGDVDPEERPTIERTLRRSGLEEPDDSRPVKERRTDAAVAELVVSNPTSFTIEELDEAIETGAGVGSKPSVRDYRKRVLDRLGGKDAITHHAQRDAPIDERVFFVDVHELARLHYGRVRSRREEADDDADDVEEALESAERVGDDGDPVEEEDGIDVATSAE